MIFNHHRNHLRGLLLISLSALSIAPVSLSAVYAADAPTAKVSYSDLNLSRPADVQVLYRRLKKAAADVCGMRPEQKEMMGYAAWSRCYEPALHNAVEKIDAPELLARYQRDLTAHWAHG